MLIKPTHYNHYTTPPPGVIADIGEKLDLGAVPPAGCRAEPLVPGQMGLGDEASQKLKAFRCMSNKFCIFCEVDLLWKYSI